MNKKNKIILLMLTIVIVFTGCNQNTDYNDTVESSELEMSFEITDMSGEKIVISKIPKRIVSLSPTNTEILFALGAGDNIVGVTTYCDYPEEAKLKDKIGDFSGQNLELILNAKPDIVLAGSYMQEDIINGLKNLGIPVVSTEATSISEIFTSIELVGKITGRNESAEQVISKMKNSLLEINNKTTGSESIPVFYVVWTEPLQTAGKNTFIDEVITLAGGTNIAGNLESWAHYSKEELLRKNPYGIISARHSREEAVEAQTIEQDPLFRELDASKNHRVYIMKDDNIISRGGPRIVEAIEEMRLAIESWR